MQYRRHLHAKLLVVGWLVSIRGVSATVHQSRTLATCMQLSQHSACACAILSGSSNVTCFTTTHAYISCVNTIDLALRMSGHEHQLQQHESHANDVQHQLEVAQDHLHASCQDEDSTKAALAAAEEHIVQLEQQIQGLQQPHQQVQHLQQDVHSSQAQLRQPLETPDQVPQQQHQGSHAQERQLQQLVTQTANAYTDLKRLVQEVRDQVLGVNHPRISKSDLSRHNFVQDCHALAAATLLYDFSACICWCAACHAMQHL